MILKSDQVVAVGAQILLAQLHRRPGTPARARIDQPHRLHRPEAQRIPPAPRDLFDRKTRLEIRHIARNMRLHCLRRQQRIDKTLVLGLRERAVQIIPRAVERLVVTRCRKRNAPVDGVRIDNRADAVVKKQAVRNPSDARSTAASPSLVSGPVAMMVSRSGSISVISSRRISIAGCDSIAPRGFFREHVRDPL